MTEPLFRILQYAEQQHALYLDPAGYIDLENHEDLLTLHEEYAITTGIILKLAAIKSFWMVHPREEPHG